MPVVFGGRADRGSTDEALDRGVTAQLHSRGKPCRQTRDELIGDGFVDEQRLESVANTRPLRLGVFYDSLGDVEVSRRVHEHVADAFVVLDDRDTRVLGDVADETF